VSECWLRRLGGCDGRVERAHLVPKQRLRRDGLDEADVWDPRVLVPLCRRHHHRLDQGFVEVDRADLPARFAGWLEEHGYGWAPGRGWVRRYDPGNRPGGPLGRRH
jgi:hypothetical protein